jgi:hypothetical protein
MTTNRTGTPAQYEELSRLASSIVAQADQVRRLALELGEIGTMHEAESTRTSFAHLAAVARVRASEARLTAGELTVTGPNAVDAIYASIDYWRAASTKAVTK